MKITTSWQDEAENVAPEERATVADVRIIIGPRNVAIHVDGEIVEDEITIPIYSLALGIVENWWRLFGGRDHQLRLIDFCSGFEVPDVRLWSDGQRVYFQAVPRASECLGIEYVHAVNEDVSRTEAEHRLDSIVSVVLARLDERSVTETGAHLRWERIRDSRADPDEAAFCEAAGALGRDPYQIDEADAELIEQSAGLFSGEGLLEFLSGTDYAHHSSALEWIERTEARPAAMSAVPGLWLPRIAAMFPDTPPPARAWQLGYPRARAFRAELGLTSTDRTRSAEALARRLGSSPRYASAAADPSAVSGIRAVRSDGPDAQVHIHLRRTVRDEAALFAFARACGDVVCFPEKGRSVVNDLQAAYRQAAGRAFAAEFLAPIEEIRSMEADGYDRLAMADEFGVSSEVIDRQLENASRIDEACAA